VEGRRRPGHERVLGPAAPPWSLPLCRVDSSGASVRSEDTLSAEDSLSADGAPEQCEFDHAFSVGR